MIQPTPRTIRRILTAVFLFCLLYWTYLAFISEMVIVHDSIGYETLGKMVAHDGWLSYFTGGPKREPIYPFLIASSMKLAGPDGSYQLILKFFQFGILFSTQWLCLLILTMLGISPLISAAVILYLGISPALVNSSLSLYSEIAAYPWVLLLIFIHLKVRQKIGESGPALSAGHGLAFGLTAVALCLVKGIFELIIPLLLLPSLIMSAVHWQRDRRWARNAMTFTVTAATIFFLLINGYKFLNWKYNGNFVLTNRAASALYGNTARRVEPVRPGQYLTALAFVPGQDFCASIFGAEECLFWSFRRSDDLSEAQTAEFARQGLDYHQAGKEFLRLSRKKFFERPVQYAVFYGIEGLKMFFWETTTIGFVVYPQWLSILYDSAAVNNSLRFFWFFLTAAGLAAACRRVLRRENDPCTAFTSFALWLVLLYTALYSFFLILPRYALPLAPVYLLIIALFLQDTFHRQDSRS